MTTIQVTILPDGRAREVNQKTNKKMGIRHINYESMLRTFIINYDHLESPLRALVKAAGGEWEKVSHINVGHEIGSQHTAEIIDSEKLIIRIIN